MLRIRVGVEVDQLQPDAQSATMVLEEMGLSGFFAVYWFLSPCSILIRACALELPRLPP